MDATGCFMAGQLSREEGFAFLGTVLILTSASLLASFLAIFCFATGSVLAWMPLTSAFFAFLSEATCQAGQRETAALRGRQ